MFFSFTVYAGMVKTELYIPQSIIIELKLGESVTIDAVILWLNFNTERTTLSVINNTFIEKIRSFYQQSLFDFVYLYCLCD